MRKSAEPKQNARLGRLIPAGARLLIASCAFFAATFTVDAAPFDRDLRFTQPDGTEIVIQGRGNEVNAILTYNGYDVMIVRRNGRFAYVYAKCNAAGTALEATEALAGVDEVPEGVEPNERGKVSAGALRAQIKAAVEKHEKRTGIRENWERAKEKRLKRVISKARGGIGSMTINPITGDKYGITVLVDFPDAPAPAFFPVAEAEEFTNGDNYTNFGNYSSVRSYYKDVSAGKIDYQNTVVGYVTMPNPKEYYNTMDPAEGKDPIIEFFKDLFSVLSALPTDSEIYQKLVACYDSLTTTADAELNEILLEEHVSAFNVLYAGDDGGVWGQGLWPCSGFLIETVVDEEGNETNEPLYLDLPGGGPKVVRFQISNIGEAPSISTFCHENGHMLFNFPDIYDYDYDSVGGAGKFCLMGSTFTYCPQQVCAYLKYVSGWTEPTYLVRDQQIEGAELCDATTADGYVGQNRVYVFENPYSMVDPSVPGSATEYHIFENRQKTLRDVKLPSAGIAIWHVDELGDRDDQRVTTNDEHFNYEVSLEQADGRLDFQNNSNDGDETDLWYEGNDASYYTLQNGTFSDRTRPSAKWWSGSNSFVNVDSFSVTGSVMTLNFNPAMILYTLDTMPTGRVGTYFNWRVPIYLVSSNYTATVLNGELPAGLDFYLEGNDELYIRGYPQEAVDEERTLAIVSTAGGIVKQPASFKIYPTFSLPYTETFGEGADFNAELGWFQEEKTVYSGVLTTNAYPWQLQNGNGTTGTKGNPTYAHTRPLNLAFVADDGVFNDGNTNKNDDVHAVGMLVSPMFDCSALRQVKLAFYMCKSAYNNSTGYLDHMRLYYRTSPESEWKLLQEYLDVAPTWGEYTVVLPDSTEDRSSIHFGFEALSNNGNGVHIDDVRVFDPVSEFKFAQTTLPDATINASYDCTIGIEGGIEPFVWTLDGELPPGITFNDGVFSGSCPTIGVYTFGVKVEDNNGAANSAVISNNFTIVVDRPRVVLFNETFESPFGNVPSYWTQEATSEDGTNVWWKLSCGGSEGHGQYPALAHEGAFNALLFWSDIFSYDRPNHVTRLISPEIYMGENSSGITLTFWLCMRELLRGDGKYDQDTLKVYFKEKESDPWGDALLEISTSVDTWSYQRVALPDVKSGYICFEGNALYGNGIMLDDIRVGVASESPVIVTRDLENGYASVPYSTTFSAVGGSGTQEWSVASGSTLPGGMTLSKEGVFSGSPKASGTYSFKVRVTGEDGKSYEATLSWTVLPGIRYSEVVGSFDAGMDWQAWTFSTNKIKGWEFISGSGKSEELDDSPIPSSAYSGNTNACLFHDGVSSIAKATMTTPMIDYSATSNATIRFMLCKKNNSSTYKDTLQIAYRLSYDASPVTLTNITANIGAWTPVEVKLPETSETMFIDFIGTARCGYGIAVDDIVFEGTSYKVDTVYEIWKKQWYGDKNYGDDLDSDGDGLTTEQEFAFGADPTVADAEAGLLLPTVENDEFFVTFREGKEARDYGVIFKLLWSTNLSEKVWYDDGLDFVSEADSNLWWQVIYKHEDSSIYDEPRRFFKLSVEMP